MDDRPMSGIMGRRRRSSVPLAVASMEPQLVTLHSPGCTAIWELVEGGAPLWRYWGPRLPDGCLPSRPLAEERTPRTFSTERDFPLTVSSGIGGGWFGPAIVAAHRSGRDWSFAADTCTLEQPDPHSIRFHLTDTVARISLTISARLDPATDVLTMSATLRNMGDSTLDVMWLAAGAVPLPPDARDVISWGGRHNAEWAESVEPLGGAMWRRENRQGLTSHEAPPAAIVTCTDGTAYGAQLAWSGNSAQEIALLDDRRRLWQMGEWLAPGEVRLEPGETLATPQLFVTASATGVDGVTHAFHRAMRATLQWPGGSMRPRPVHLNSWEAVYFNHEVHELMALADSAASIGVERFVLDDGWFAGRRDDQRALGDWRVDSAIYPHGLGPLAAHINALGMEFGLWVEPEMVSPDSDLYRAHPDWALGIAGREPLTARHQLVLDMSREDVRDHLFEALSALLADLPIAYLKWDHNRALTHAGERAGYRLQVAGTYELLGRLRTAFPAVEIESCAAGGGRIDAGILAYTHRFWTSDNNDALCRVAMQRSFLKLMPPELMGAHVGAAPAHSSGRSQSMAFRCGVALPGHFGVELDPRTLGEDDRTELEAGIARYKALRGQLHQGRIWMGECGDSIVWQAHGDGDKLILIVTRTNMSGGAFPPALRLPMLKPERRYRIAREGKPAIVEAGSWLTRVGFTLPRMPAESVRIFEVTAL